jgi:hypothetical protein
MSLAAKKFQDDEFLFITAGGVDGEDKDKAVPVQLYPSYFSQCL